MVPLILRNCTLVTNGYVLPEMDILISGKCIADILPAGNRNATRNEIDLQGGYLVPGFIDLQVNGGGLTYFPLHTDTESIKKIFDTHLKKGTTHLLPTMVTDSMENIFMAIRAVKDYLQKGGRGLSGMHLEGPFISPCRKGAHNPTYIQQPTDLAIESLLNEGKGIIKMMTIDPELFAPDQLDRIKKAGIVLSAGHSDISCENALKSFADGVSCVTHLYNAMSGFVGREPGLIGATLNAEVDAGIIVDGVHVNYTAVNIAVNQKGGRLFLVSDATFTEPYDEIMVRDRKFIYREGQNQNTEGKLAGASICMLDAFRNCIRELHIPIEDVVAMASEIPARVLGVHDRMGFIKKGYEANFVCLDHELRLKGVLMEGEYMTCTDE